MSMLAALTAAASAAAAAGAATPPPARPAAAARASIPVEVRVQPGDTLVDLLRDGADWTRVQQANRIADPKRLQPGRVLLIPAELLRERAAVAEVLHAYGEVSVTRAGTQTALPLAAGEPVAAGDRVRTGPQSSATLRFVDGARALVRPDSELLVERLAQSRGGAATTLRLERGSADSAVPPPGAASAPSRYEMRTPHTHLGVRGTEFRTAAETGGSRVEVLEGRVAARAPAASPRTKEALVDAGFGAVAAADGALAPARALPDAPRLDGLPQRVERMPLRLSWQAEAGTRVRAQVFAAGEPRLLLDGTFDAPPARWNQDLPDGRYELRVRAIGPGGLEGRDTRAAFELDARPEPPFAAAPAPDSRTVDENVRLAWTRNAAAPRVRLQVADTPDFARPRIDRRDLDAAELRVDLPLGTHHWRVASIAPDGDQGPFGDAQRLTRIEPPPAPPPAQPQLGDEGLLLRWPAGSAAAGTRWQVQLARDDAFTDLLIDSTVSEPQVILREPPAGTHRLRVKAIDADGFAGPWSQTQQIEVPRSPWWWLTVPALLLILL